MTPIHAGLICTLMLLGTMASMFGCMSAARCRRHIAFALCLGLTMLGAALLVALLSRLPGELSPAPWTASALLLTALGFGWRAVCFAQAGGSFRRFPSRKARITCPARCALRGKTAIPV